MLRELGFEQCLLLFLSFIQTFARCNCFDDLIKIRLLVHSDMGAMASAPMLLFAPGAMVRLFSALTILRLAHLFRRIGIGSFLLRLMLEATAVFTLATTVQPVPAMLDLIRLFVRLYLLIVSTYTSLVRHTVSCRSLVPAQLQFARIRAINAHVCTCCPCSCTKSVCPRSSFI